MDFVSKKIYNFALNILTSAVNVLSLFCIRLKWVIKIGSIVDMNSTNLKKNSVVTLKQVIDCCSESQILDRKYSRQTEKSFKYKSPIFNFLTQESLFMLIDCFDSFNQRLKLFLLQVCHHMMRRPFVDLHNLCYMLLLGIFGFIYLYC